MLSLWWQMPGPARFAARIAEDLRKGVNIIIGLPEQSPDGLRRAIANHFGSGGSEWVTLNLAGEADSRPTQQLASRFMPSLDAAALVTASMLATAEDFAGRVLWLDRIAPEQWPAWKEFLTDYEQAQRSSCPFNPTVFCVPLTGELCFALPPEDMRLVHHHWRGMADRLDMLLFTSTIFQERRLPDLQRRLAVSVAAGLALWDPAVSERLAYENLEVILHPLPVLREMASERGWHKMEDSSANQQWAKGIQNIIEGRQKMHSAVLALNDSGEIDRRVWSAEVGVMLPFVEEARQTIIAQIANVLTVPFRTRFGNVITDIRDLEIGHIERQVVGNGLPVGEAMRRLIQQLNKIRNHLSHREPLDPMLLIFDDLESLDGF